MMLDVYRHMEHISRKFTNGAHRLTDIFDIK